jgi:hypothetical protein
VSFALGSQKTALIPKMLANSSDWGSVPLPPDPAGVFFLVLLATGAMATVFYVFRSVACRQAKVTGMDRIAAFLAWVCLSAIVLGLPVLRFGGLFTLVDKLFFPLVFLAIAIGVGGSRIHWGRPTPTDRIADR